jgi:hypothetical protein
MESSNLESGMQSREMAKGELATRYLKQEPITIEGNRARAGGADVGTGYLQFGS